MPRAPESLGTWVRVLVHKVPAQDHYFELFAPNLMRAMRIRWH